MAAEAGQIQVDGEASKQEEEEVTFESSKVIKNGTSIVWKFFFFKGTKESGVKKDKVFCKHCKGKIQEKGMQYCNSTSSLYDHLKRHHKTELDEANIEADNSTGKKGQKQGPITSFYKSKSEPVKWSKNSTKWKAATDALTKFVIKDGRPANMIECEGFKEFVHEICPEYEVPCKVTINNRMEKMYEVEKEKLKTELKEQEFVAVTSDGGSSSNSASYQDTNVHFITKNFELKSKILSVKENKESHTAINYRKNTDDVLEEFGIKDKVVKTVTDNENKMKAAFTKEERNGCVSHIMHKSYETGTKVKVVKDTILKTRKIGRKHNKSHKMKYGLEKAQKKRLLRQKPIQQDVENRWGSTRQATASYLDDKDGDTDDEDMLSNTFADEFKNCEAVNEALRGLDWRKSKGKGKDGKEKLEEYLLTRSDMLRIRNLNKFLIGLDVYSTTLGGNKFVTSSVVMPAVKSMQKHLKVNEEDPGYISQMKKDMLEDFRERCADNLDMEFLCKTSALDPRFKNLKVLKDKSARDKVFEGLEGEAKAAADSVKDNKEPVDKKKRKLEYGLDFDQSDEEDSDQDDVKREVEEYRKEEAPSHGEDPLAWWKERRHRYSIILPFRLLFLLFFFLFLLFFLLFLSLYSFSSSSSSCSSSSSSSRYPHLARLARRYLCVPATSTEAERVFSGLSFLLTKQRMAMTGDHVNMQLFLKDKL